VWKGADSVGGPRLCGYILDKYVQNCSRPRHEARSRTHHRVEDAHAVEVLAIKLRGLCTVVRRSPDALRGRSVNRGAGRLAVQRAEPVAALGRVGIAPKKVQLGDETPARGARADQQTRQVPTVRANRQRDYVLRSRRQHVRGQRLAHRRRRSVIQDCPFHPSSPLRRSFRPGARTVAARGG